jgi:hypothetical protein
MEDESKIGVGEFSQIVDKVVELLDLKETLRRIEAKVDAIGGVSPELQKKIDDAVAKLNANDAAVAAAQKSETP